MQYNIDKLSDEIIIHTGTSSQEKTLNFSFSPPSFSKANVVMQAQHGPFPAYLKRFHLSDSDYCSCGGIDTALHYATECIYTVYWHMRKPTPNFEQECLKRVGNNLVSGQKIH
ncbi:hypothetical protein AVEN_89642-1 [Araneus ventricosus]|uniref:Uncharacterized protein n=1 Tax=Araneus ventricosus TaxID=182803 RepID=A0A4Y2EXA5_ARAVE|nr:hypothetical protein AVEN_89642-1 [Araneus ventricosus]